MGATSDARHQQTGSENGTQGAVLPSALQDSASSVKTEGDPGSDQGTQGRKKTAKSAAKKKSGSEVSKTSAKATADNSAAKTKSKKAEKKDKSETKSKDAVK